MLKLMYFPANSAWAFVFGDNLATAEVLKLDGESMFFPSRSEAQSAAERRGVVAA